MGLFVWLNLIVMGLVAFFIPFMTFKREQLKLAAAIAGTLLVVPLLISLIGKGGFTENLAGAALFQRGIISLFISISYGIWLGLMLYGIKIFFISKLKKHADNNMDQQESVG